MRALRPVLVVGLALLLTGVAVAQPRPQEAILGKWEMTRKEGETDLKITLEFLRDGRTTMELEAKSGKETSQKKEEGTYKWINDETIEVTIDKEAERARVKVTDRELTLTPKSGAAMKFTRIGK
jgi:uncharacterized protein (TIGR03066 family)